MGKITINSDDQSHESSATHTMLEKSSTLARKYVKRPTTRKMVDAKVDQAELRRRQYKANVMNHKSLTPKTTKKVIQEKAAKSAMRSVAKMNDDTPKMKTKRKPHRIALAVLCSAITVCALFFFVQTNMPDITVKVAAMQTGIDATYPSYIPRNYALDTVTSEKDGSITMTFRGPDDAGFTLTEEKSTWDSTALLNNFVKKNYSADYATLRERGITVYVDRGNATWVNGGLLYKTTSQGKNLSKEQIINLVSSL
ncbi:DUF4367 domain-containing protein [Candidatus Saccharibacteria bacterium]|nr:DUF4367 domain-containing protein [Candidatus Saccharibacteria bacterium]